jgi:hypothetical protein
VYPVEYESKEKLENDFLEAFLKLREQWDAHTLADAEWRKKYDALAEKSRKARKPGVTGELDEQMVALFREKPATPPHSLVFLGEEFYYSDLYYRSDYGKREMQENFPDFYTLDEWFEANRIGKES